jgi:hypothetical protein
MRQEFARMVRGEPIVEIGKRARVLQDQPVDEETREAYIAALDRFKLRPDERQKRIDAYESTVGAIHYGGAGDATVGPMYLSFARYPMGAGRANTSSRSALRGIHARRLSDLLPVDMTRADRVGIVTELLREIGFTDTKAENVGSILRRQKESASK